MVVPIALRAQVRQVLSVIALPRFVMALAASTLTTTIPTLLWRLLRHATAPRQPTHAAVHLPLRQRIRREAQPKQTLPCLQPPQLRRLPHLHDVSAKFRACSTVLFMKGRRWATCPVL